VPEGPHRDGQIGRELRSQVCTRLEAAINAVDDKTVTFTNDRRSPPTKRDHLRAGALRPGRPGKIVGARPGRCLPAEHEFNGVGTTTALLSNVLPIAGVPIPVPVRSDVRRHRAVRPPLAIPLTTSAPRSSRRRSASASSAPAMNTNVDQRLASTFQNDVYTRVADPSAPNWGPTAR
jgi:hypothetical protein